MDTIIGLTFGKFVNFGDAVKIRDAAEAKYFGEFSCKKSKMNQNTINTNKTRGELHG